MTDPVPSSLLRQEGPQQEREIEYVPTDRHIEQAGGDLLDDLTEAAFITETLTDAEVDRLHQMVEWRIRQAITHRMRYGLEDPEAILLTSRAGQTELQVAQARIEVLEGSIDYLRNVIDHPVKQEKKTTKI